MKLLVPVAIALVGLGAGVGAGFLLKPPPPEGHAAAECEEPAAVDAHAEGDAAGAGVKAAHGAEETHAAEDAAGHGAAATDPCAEAAGVDPFKPADHRTGADGHGEAAVYVPFEKPFVIPVFSGEKVVSMVVISLSVATHVENPDTIHAMEPRLRDRLLEALFLHSNSGGFNGSFTTGRKIEDLKTALVRAAQGVVGAELVTEVLITEINRQDV
jgi:flagellar protein FliL